MSSPVVPSTIVTSSVEQTYLGMDTLHVSPPANTTEHEREQVSKRYLSVNSLHPFSSLASPQRTLKHRDSLLGLSSFDDSQEGSCSNSSQQEHYASPSDFSRETPFVDTVDVAKSYILDGYEGCQGIRFRTPKEVFFDKEIQALLDPAEEQDRPLVKRYHYELDSCELTIVFMLSPIHGAIFPCIVRSHGRFTAYNDALEPLELFSSYPGLKCSSLPRRRRKVTGMQKVPDAGLMWLSSPPIWAVIFEVGFSETFEQLIDDASEWLLSFRMRPVSTVVIIKIDEDRATCKSDESTKRVHSLIARFGDDRTRERFGIEANNDVMGYDEAAEGIEQELDVKDWVGDLRVYAEKWKLQDGEPQRYGPRVEIFPTESAQEHLSIPFINMIPEKDYARIKDDIPQDFLVKTDRYPQFLKYAIQHLARTRATRFIRQEGRGDDDSEFNPV